ncbi:MAG: DUF4129 domain-containing protein [Chitinophagaceae bacterium]
MKRMTYRTGSWIKAGIVSVMLLLLSGMLQAQDEDDAPATADTIAPVVVPAEDETVYDEEEDDSGISEQFRYFEPNWLFVIPDSLQQRHVSDSALAATRSDKAFWYVNTVFKKEKERAPTNRPAGSSGGGGFLNALLWMIVIGAFIAFLFIYLSGSNVRLFRGSKTIKEADDTKDVSDDIFTISHQQADKAAAAGDYRLAVRLLFLLLLRRLADKNLIRYTPESTNFDYLLQVQAAPWYRQFFRVTRHYEYVWYGRFDINPEQFKTIRNDFTTLEQQL